MTKSIRLTKQIRDDILKSVMDEYTKQNKAPDLKSVENAYALKILKRYIGKKDWEALQKVPEKYLKRSENVLIKVNGIVKHLSLGKHYPTDKGHYNILEIVEDIDKDYIKYRQAFDKMEEWLNEKRDLKRETRAILDSVNTSKQLLEAWPQVEPFLPAYIADAEKAVRLPAIQVSRLNERIGINEKKTSKK